MSNQPGDVSSKQSGLVLKLFQVLGIDLNKKEIVTSENKRYVQATKTKTYKIIKKDCLRGVINGT